MNRKWLATMLLAALLCCALATCALAYQPVEITSTTDHGNGKVTIKWNNPNGGAVTVGSLVLGSEYAGNKINIEQDVYGSSYTFEALAPGMEYYLMAMPELDLDNAGITMVTVKEPGSFDNFRLTLKESYLMYAKFRSDGNYTYNYAKDLSTKKIYSMLEEQAFLVRLDFRHPVFSSSRTLPILTVVTAPTGYVMTDYNEVKIPSNCDGFWQTTMFMNNHLATMYDNYGEIPTGRYDVKVYVDGEYLGATHFSL